MTSHLIQSKALSEGPTYLASCYLYDFSYHSPLNSLCSSHIGFLAIFQKYQTHSCLRVLFLLPGTLFSQISYGLFHNLFTGLHSNVTCSVKFPLIILTISLLCFIFLHSIYYHLPYYVFHLFVYCLSPSIRIEIPKE